MRFQGRVSSWKDEQGFGFISPNGGGAPVFLHIKAFARRTRRPLAGDLVTYEQTTDARGRPRAENVVFVEAAVRVAAGAGGKSTGVLPLVAVAFLLLVAGCVLVGRLPLAVAVLYGGASLLAFALYAWDKSAAQGGHWRTAEKTLHIIALIGGWPGALVAQRVLRHKSRKTSFQLVFWTTVLVNCGMLGWLLTANGAAALRMALAAG